MKAMNKAYDVPESRPFWMKYLLSLGLTLLASIFFIAAAILLFAGQFYTQDILEWMGLSTGWATTLITWLRWPVIIALVMLAVSFLYWASPNIDLPFRLVSPGNVAFVLAWIAASAGFIFYVSNFGSYNATYGALGGVIILLIWIYFTSLLLLLGAEIDAMTNQSKEPEQMNERRRRKQEEAAAKGKADTA